MPIPLPPLAEQRRIVAEVERRLSRSSSKTRPRSKANLTRAERLRQSILKQAFSGNLVPQDPNVEPASRFCWSASKPSERTAAGGGESPSAEPRRRRARSLDPDGTSS